MKSVIEKGDKDKVSEYPCLKVIMEGFPGSGTVVCFTSECVGFVVSESDYYVLFHRRTNWSMDVFKPFHGKVILSNE